MKKHIAAYTITASTQALVAALLLTVLLALSFFIVEPQVSRGQLVDTSSDFSIRQTITGENSFTTDPANVTMDGDIAGLTGGNATGTTQFAVRSNSATGYFVQIDFEDNAGAHAMRGDISGGEEIVDYQGTTAGQPSFGFNVAATSAAQFGYTVIASSSDDVAQGFKNDGSGVCGGAETGTTPDVCWQAPSTTPYTIVSKSSASAGGATSTIKFLVHVPNNATPAPNAETYTATATLTLFTQ